MMTETAAETTTSAKPQNHFAFIDALRGPAAIVVMLLHLQLRTQGAYSATGLKDVLDQLFDFFDLGKFAVVVFFLVSGFLIPTSLDETGSIKVFAIRRFWRLYPCYWLSIAAVLVLAQLGAMSDAPISPIIVAANITMAQRYLGQPEIIGSFWTLQFELTFYVLCAAMFFLGLFGERRIYVVYASLFIALALASVKVTPGNSLSVELFLALALMFLADGFRRNDRRAGRATLYSLVGVILVSLFAFEEFALRYILTYDLAIVTFLIAMKHRSWPGFQSRWFRRSGDISYGVYLLHDPIGITLATMLALRGYSQGVAISLGVVATLVAAWFVFRFIEKPGIRIGRNLSGPPRLKLPILGNETVA
jgi:peptidoglycan/LPS O-acetylase OafA/YrhL